MLKSQKSRIFEDSKNPKRIFRSQKHVFWQALVLALFLFISGLLLGFALESYRTSKITKLYLQADVDLLDTKILSQAFSLVDLNCEEAEKENIEFADRVYEEALLLQDLEDAQKLTESLKMQHKKYDLLRTLLWLNSMELRKRCNSSYHNIVYLYNYEEDNLEKRAKQKVFSNILAELKSRNPEKVILIPIAANLDLVSINLLLKTYGIATIPAVLIDEKIKVEEVETVEQLEEYLS